jgi:hypothetical protein
MKQLTANQPAECKGATTLTLQTRSGLGIRQVRFTVDPQNLFILILLRVYGSVTNNNIICFGWLDLLTPSFTIFHNHNQFTITQNKWLHWTRSVMTCSIVLLFNCAWLTSDLRLTHFWCTTDSLLIYECLGSSSNGCLYSVSVSQEMFFECSFTRKRVLYRIGLQEATSMLTCFPIRSLAMYLHVTILYCFLSCIQREHLRGGFSSKILNVLFTLFILNLPDFTLLKAVPLIQLYGRPAPHKGDVIPGSAFYIDHCPEGC